MALSPIQDFTPNYPAYSDLATKETHFVWDKLIYVKTNVGGYFFDAFLKMDHTSTATITEHPIQTGANVSDHMIIQPGKLVMSIGMSDVMKSIIDGQFSDSWSRSVSAYNILLDMQKQRVPLTILTRLKQYTNMLIEEISTSDDYKTQYSLECTVTFKEIFVARVTTVKVSARPQITGSTNRGSPEPVKPNESIYYQMAVSAYGQTAVDKWVAESGSIFGGGNR